MRVAVTNAGGLVRYAPMPLGSFESARVEPLLTEVWSPTMVEVEEERLKVLASGARWVSFNFLVSFHDMAAAVEENQACGREGSCSRAERMSVWVCVGR